MHEDLTPAEVVALFGVDERRIRKDVEYGVLEGRKGPPRFALAEVVYFAAMAGIGLELAVEDRKRLYRMIAAALGQRPPPARLEVGTYFEVKLSTVVRDVEQRIERFSKWKRKLVTRDDILGGETVFPKSRLAVRQVGEMAHRGARVKEIIEDYPNLDEQDVEFARLFARAYPRVGRPRVRQISTR